MGKRQDDQNCLLFDALSELFPVSFRPVQGDTQDGLDALLVLNGNLGAGLAAAAAGVPSYVVVEAKYPPVEPAGQQVCFGKSVCLDHYLLGQTMAERGHSVFCPLTPEPGDEIVAFTGNQTIWLNRPAGRRSCQLVSFPPPAIQRGEFLFQYLKGPGFMRLLPLLNFLRYLVMDTDWQDTPLRACFVFDDPNLNWPKYGFLDYRRLAEHAAEHNYYVSVATVPLDTWRVNNSVAETFKASSQRLSLLIHGNNHTFDEMLSHNNEAGQLALAAQAMRRMDRLELEHQTPFLRIMEPPHGAIAYEMFEHLLALGYEAALVTPELLVRHNPHNSLAATFGMGRSELLCGGLPVIPRIRMSKDWKNEVLLAAFLRQPIILAGHHSDAMDGLKLLANFARLVNHFKNVIWASPLEIVRSNYKELRQDDVLNLKAYSRNFRVRVPDGVKCLLIHRPWLRNNAVEEMLIIKDDGRVIFQGVGDAVLGPITVTPSRVLEVCSPPPKQVDYRTVSPPRPRCWPMVRKILTEMRDRSAPCRHAVTKMLSPARNGNPAPETERLP